MAAKEHPLLAAGAVMLILMLIPVTCLDWAERSRRLPTHEEALAAHKEVVALRAREEQDAILKKQKQEQDAVLKKQKQEVCGQQCRETHPNCKEDRDHCLDSCL